jgi:hypothetical protein
MCTKFNHHSSQIIHMYCRPCSSFRWGVVQGGGSAFSSHSQCNDFGHTSSSLRFRIYNGSEISQNSDLEDFRPPFQKKCFCRSASRAPRSHCATHLEVEVAVRSPGYVPGSVRCDAESSHIGPCAQPAGGPLDWDGQTQNSKRRSQKHSRLLLIKYIHRHGVQHIFVLQTVGTHSIVKIFGVMSLLFPSRMFANSKSLMSCARVVAKLVDVTVGPETPWHWNCFMRPSQRTRFHTQTPTTLATHTNGQVYPYVWKMLSDTFRARFVNAGRYPVRQDKLNK